MSNDAIWNLVVETSTTAINNIHQYHSREAAVQNGLITLIETLLILNATSGHIRQSMQAYRFVINGMNHDLAKKASGLDLDIHFDLSEAA